MSRDYELHPFRPPVELQIDYARELNPQQLAAVTASPGPALVIAGAGSGKTRTLTYRVAWLIEQGIPADRMLLLTFTNKAAKEMMRRVSDLLGHELGSLWGGTFHSIGNRILRQHAGLLGYERSFSILDREDAKSLVAAAAVDAGLDLKQARYPKAEVLTALFSLATNKLATLGEVLEEDYQEFAGLAPALELVRQRFGERKVAGNAMDFDDLLFLWLKLMREHDEVRELYQRRFQFILVDEYQDTNRLQSELIDTLATRHKNVMAVGDDAQSIYAWRGANFKNILEFPQRYPGAAIYKIETNYRSTPEILELANASINNNTGQFTKKLESARKSGTRPVMVACQTASEQAAFVGQRILELHEEGSDLRECAVLYRSHFHALELQLELTRRNIPFSITSGIRYFEQAHVKDVTAYLKLARNPRDELSFKRLAQLLPGIGGKAADKLWKGFLDALPRRSETPVDTTQVEGRPAAAGEQKVAATALQACAALVPKKAAVSWAQFVATIAQLEAPELKEKPGDMIKLVLEAVYADYLKEEYSNYQNREEDLEQIAIFARRFGSTEEFLNEMALLTNLEAEDDHPENKDDDRVRLSTIHQAKGLEFDNVFVIMLCDGLFPSRRSTDNLDKLEEERRLMYVAITRARKELYLSYPLIRESYEHTGDMRQRPSLFLSELPTELLETWNLKPYSAW